MTAWRWVDPQVVQAIHDRQLGEHGGLAGSRDPGAVASALARPQNLAAYGDPDAAALAAAYAYGLARNHGFSDGNKRTAWVVARLFLADNGYRLRFDAADAVRTVEALAGGTLPEADLAVWFRERLERVLSP
ncbi:MAG: type II toxin-antitoxin system death-on-curing family toxin [Terriglobus roseus]|nr:type II toxin-antitoxin system death-on-curing family toxin [Terriglobus roseus]